jgi:DNA-binding transcriptional LysR family regulator
VDASFRLGAEPNASIGVIEAGFIATARKLGQSQPAIRKAGVSLEKRLGVALLNRSTRSVSAIDEGGS